MPTSHGGSADLAPELDRLDPALLAIRSLVNRPAYRRRIRELLPARVELTTVRVLRAVERAGDTDPTIGDIAEALVIDPSTASRFVDRVVERGEVERRACSADRRRTRVGLTAAGRATLAAVTEARRTVLAEVTDGWDPADVGALATLLERLHESVDALGAGEGSPR